MQVPDTTWTHPDRAGFEDLPPATVEAAGLDAEAMRDAWSHLEARGAARLRLRETRGAAGRAEDRVP